MAPRIVPHMLLVLLAAPALSGCLTSGPPADVLGTFYPTTYLAEEIAGDAVEVRLLIEGGGGPHDWEPTPLDMVRITKADLVVAQHPALEAWLADALDSIGSDAPAVIYSAAGLVGDELPGHEGHAHDDGHEEGHDDAEGDHHADHADHDDHDDHAAHGEGNATVDNHTTHEDHHEGGNHTTHDDHHEGGNHTTHEDHNDDGNVTGDDHATHEDHNDDGNITGDDHATHEDGHDEGHDGHGDAPGDDHGHDHGGIDPHTWLDPVRFEHQANAIRDALIATFPEHTATFTANAADLVARLHGVHEAFEAGLQECRTRHIVTQHDAFGHLAARYDITVHAVTGLSPEAEPNPDTIQRVLATMRAHDINTVFVEPLVNPDIMDTIARETGATVDVLNPLESRTQADIDAGRDYIDIMKRNLVALQAAMECTA